MDAFDSAASVALDPEADIEERKAALKEAIMACMEGDEEGEYDEEPSESGSPKKKGGKALAALLFGGK